jgi:PBSX family phage portal protein
MSDEKNSQNEMAGPMAFSFGDPLPVVDARGWLDYIECAATDRWYEPPVSTAGLAKALRSAVHHESAVHFKVNILTSCFKPTPLLSRQSFKQLALDYVVMANAYLEEVQNLYKRTKVYRPSLAKYTRRGIDLESFFFVQNWADPYEFKNNVFHIRQVDVDQEIYGVPQYMASLQSAFLNENATLFRRKYYLNGSHAGFILYVNDTAQSQADIDSMREALKESKGVGNFRNLFMYSPNGKKDGVQVIPISEVAAKDEFSQIKDVTAQDQLASHRIPPALMGIVPKTNGGFGSIEQAAAVFGRNEIAPLMTDFEMFNDQAGDDIIKFDRYSIETAILDGAGGLGVGAK